ncbi:tyrosine-protein phosphatase non-receptor type 20 isoform X1 [Castor canadensis]|uniref:Tyrosine-protein phosphatase non-receptor type 20 isoform X1 n=4 Tax=Castor canadensis TaxID=51338 RepID=A0AC58N1J6_CASCN
MSSPKKVRGKSGKDDKRDDSDSEDLNFLKTLPSSSKKKTSIKQVFEKKVKSEKVKPSLPNFSRNDYGYLFEEPSESESDETVWDDNIFFKRDGWNSEDTEAAGPSSTVSSVLPDIKKIVSEGELDQLAQIRPLTFNFNEQSATKDCLNMLKKKVQYGIIQEFMDLELSNLPGEFRSGNEPRNREKNRYRDILPFQHHEYSDPNEKTTLWHDSNKGTVSLLL